MLEPLRINTHSMPDDVKTDTPNLQIGSDIGRYCPLSGGADALALALQNAVKYIRDKLPSGAPTAAQKLESFKNQFFTVVGASLGVAIAVFGAPAETVLVAAAVAIYQGVCLVGTGFSIAGSSCDVRTCVSTRFNHPLLTR